MNTLKLTVGIPPNHDAPDHVRFAEQLGYEGAFLFDTPFQGDDVWHQLHRVAERTSSIDIGPGVLVPSLRHPLVNAANTVSLHQLAPGRVTVGFGTGFFSRAATGLPPVRWAYVESYIRTYMSLLAGGLAEWEGGTLALLLPPHLRGKIPLRVPILLGSLGPKGDEVARRLGVEGVIGLTKATPVMRKYRRASLVLTGTVLEPGESVTAERVRLAVGPMLALRYQYTYTAQGREALRLMPGGEQWLEVIERTPRSRRHLAVHDGHTVFMNRADEAAWEGGAHTLLKGTTVTGTAEEVRDYVRAQHKDGATEIMYQPAGPDIRRELSAFINAVRGS